MGVCLSPAAAWKPFSTLRNQHSSVQIPAGLGAPGPQRGEEWLPWPPADRRASRAKLGYLSWEHGARFLEETAREQNGTHE